MHRRRPGSTPAPVSLCRDLGADLVIGVDVNQGPLDEDLRCGRHGAGPRSTPTRPPRTSEPPEVIERSLDITQARLARERMLQHPPDVLISPAARPHRLPPVPPRRRELRRRQNGRRGRGGRAGPGGGGGARSLIGVGLDEPTRLLYSSFMKIPCFAAILGLTCAVVLRWSVSSHPDGSRAKARSNPPLWVSAEAAADSQTVLNQDLLEPHPTLSQVIERQRTAGEKSGPAPRRTSGERPQVRSILGEPCNFTIVQFDHLDPRCPSGSVQDLLDYSLAIFEGVITSIQPGFFQGAPASLLTVKVGDWLRVPEDGYKAEPVVQVYHPAAHFTVGNVIGGATGGIADRRRNPGLRLFRSRGGFRSLPGAPQRPGLPLLGRPSRDSQRVAPGPRPIESGPLARPRDPCAKQQRQPREETGLLGPLLTSTDGRSGKLDH